MKQYCLQQILEDLAFANIDCEFYQFQDGQWQSELISNISFHGAEIDSRNVSEGVLFLGLPGENVDGGLFAQQALCDGASIAIATKQHLSTDGDLKNGSTLIFVEDVLQAMTALASGKRERLSAKVIAITGTNGKTTTKDMLVSILSAAGETLGTTGNLNNQIGLPLTLLRTVGNEKYIVLEMGASAKGDIDELATIAKPDAAIITNAFEAHLEGFGSLDVIIETKGELIDHITGDDFIVLNKDTNGFEKWNHRANCRVVSFSKTDPLNRWAIDGDQVTIGEESFLLPMPGEHNGANLVSALLVSFEFGLTADEIRNGLKRFIASAHRGNLISVDGFFFFDDSYNANPESVMASSLLVRRLAKDRAIVVLGQMAELGKSTLELHFETGEKLFKIGIDICITVGDASPLAVGFVEAGGEAVVCQNHDEAVEWLVENHQTDDLVLLKGSRSSKMELILEKYLEQP